MGEALAILFILGSTLLEGRTNDGESCTLYINVVHFQDCINRIVNTHLQSVCSYTVIAQSPSVLS